LRTGAGRLRTKIVPTREAAAIPAKSLYDYKCWPHVGRVDNFPDDRNPVCSCVGMENYAS
jgi:glycine dehydrogenase